RAVTRNEYAAFAQATDRAEAGCRIRTALMTLKKRSWRDPGFKQGGNHPAVCVSVADASAYASWLSQRDGLTYRLPSATEWQSAANLAGFAEACQAQRIACAGKGTAPTDSGPMTSAAVHAMHGNVREWPAGCGADCRTHAALGASWRDTPTASASDNEVDARYGYDDIGFRLVRDVGREEVEQR
ncbi:MAG: SUMF1/EgtB/PvdO family nonheme iron enzyme, partial [Xanthomonadales bacterium]|nr:SUMF1/EgtB/PvdO family nonheme iron enzyme [Xanthomonadales bacterium]